MRALVVFAFAVAIGRGDQAAEPAEAGVDAGAEAEVDPAVEAMLAGVEDPATVEILRHVFARMAVMEKEIKRLRGENAKIRDALNEQEGKSEELVQRIDQLDKQQAGIPSVATFVSRLSLFGVRNAAEVGPRLHAQGISTVPNLLDLSQSEQIDLKRNFTAGLQIQLDKTVSLRNQLSGFGVAQAVPMEAALQAQQVHRLGDLVAMDKSEIEHLCEELRKVEFSAAYQTDVPGQLRHTPRMPLPLGDRALVRRLAVSLRVSGGILGFPRPLSPRRGQQPVPEGDVASKASEAGLSPNATATEIVSHATTHFLTQQSERFSARLMSLLRYDSVRVALLVTTHREPFASLYVVSVRWLQRKLDDSKWFRSRPKAGT